MGFGFVVLGSDSKRLFSRSTHACTLPLPLRVRSQRIRKSTPRTRRRKEAAARWARCCSLREPRSSPCTATCLHPRCLPLASCAKRVEGLGFRHLKEVALLASVSGNVRARVRLGALRVCVGERALVCVSARACLALFPCMFACCPIFSLYYRQVVCVRLHCRLDTWWKVAGKVLEGVEMWLLQK